MFLCRMSLLFFIGRAGAKTTLIEIEGCMEMKVKRKVFLGLWVVVLLGGQKRKNRLLGGFFFILNLAMTYSRTIVRCTTIGVTAFHFCVRNGDRWYYSTMVARKTGDISLTFSKMAERTGLEPATSCVTGRHSNQLNYRSA